MPSTKAPASSSADGPLNIVLQEDLTIRGGAQLWLMNCGVRLQQAGHNVTFILPSTSMLLEDLEEHPEFTLYTYDAEAIAANAASFEPHFTEWLQQAHVCVTLVRPQRGHFQNVQFVATCIAQAGLQTQLIAKTGTPDPTYQKFFYGGPLLQKDPPQCCVITIAQYTKDFIVENMGVPSHLITNVYNGTDTKKFQRTPELKVEAYKRYPCVDGAYVVGCIGSLEERKAQSVLLKAAKQLIDDGRLPHIYCLLVGEGPDKDMLQELIHDLQLEDHAALCDFTKQPFYVFERCDLVALPSTGKEGLPNVLLEALAMETPCVATRAYGMAEVVVDGETGYCFPSGDVDALADAICKIANKSPEEQHQMAQVGKELIFAEHDKAKQFEKILDIIKERAALAV